MAGTGIVGRVTGGRLLIAAAAAFMLLSSGSATPAEAHKSNYCGHGNKTGTYWWAAYDYGWWTNYNGGGPEHWHNTDHFYGVPGGFKKYKHSQNKLCVVDANVALAAQSPNTPQWDLCVPTDPEAGGEICPPSTEDVRCAPTFEVNTHLGCDHYLPEDLPVDSPTVSDPQPSDLGPIPPPICLSLTCGRATTSAAVARRAAEADVPATWLELRSDAEGRLRNRRVSGGKAAYCVTSITNVAGGRLTPKAAARTGRRAEIEIAAPALARSLGHGC